MSDKYLDESCKNCQYYNPDKSPLYCNYTGPSIRCNVLKRNVKLIKFKRKLI